MQVYGDGGLELFINVASADSTHVRITCMCRPGPHHSNRFGSPLGYRWIASAAPTDRTNATAAPISSDMDAKDFMSRDSGNAQSHFSRFIFSTSARIVARSL